MRVRVIHIGSDDADTRTRGSFIFSSKFKQSNDQRVWMIV